MILKIRQTTDPILREETEKVADFDHELQFLIDNMIETMRKNEGIGLAAPQVGISKKVFICEFAAGEDAQLKSFPLTVICNPEIISLSKERVKMVEGCLSFPELGKLVVERPKNVKIKGQDRYGKPLKIETDSLFSRVLQHENDHLNSNLLIDHLCEIKIVFIGTGTLGLKALKLLAGDVQYKIVAVITGEDGKRQSSRQKSTNTPIENLANELDLPLIKTSNINDDALIQKITPLKPDLGIMADFGQIISEKILNIPKYGIINIHPSLLPKYRGPSPIQAAILAGDKISGVSLILTSKKMDAGGIIASEKIELSPAETFTTLKDSLSKIAGMLLLNTIPYYIAGDLKPIPQDEAKATYTKLIKASDALVGSATPKEEVEKKIRAYDQWPKVYSNVNNKRVQILSAYMNENNELVITRVRPEGKKEMSYEDFKHGYKTELTFN